MMVVPENGVVVKSLCGIKPEVQLLFSSSSYTTISVHVGLQNPLPCLLVSEQLDVDLVVVVRENISI